MRSTDIVSLFEYLYWLRDGALAKAEELTPAEFIDPSTAVYRDLRATLVHELDVERSWRLRLQGASKDMWGAYLEPADYPDPASIADQWARDEAEAVAWISDLTDEELAAPITVNGLEGFALSTYLIHVVMHGVESIFAAAILLHRGGHSMGDVGFLDFVDAAGEPPTPPARRPSGTLCRSMPGP